MKNALLYSAARTQKVCRLFELPDVVKPVPVLPPSNVVKLDEAHHSQ
jgi:hypothetical protein